VELKGDGEILFNNLHFKPAVWSDGGAGIKSERSIWIQGPEVHFRDCSTDGSGGALLANKNVTLQDASVSFENCTAVVGGGAVASSSVFVSGRGSYTFSGCHANKGYGGGVLSYKAVHFESEGMVAFRNCSANYGGAVNSYAGLHMSGSGHYIFAGCHARFGGGAVCTYTSLGFSGNGQYAFTDCKADTSGGAIHTSGSLDVSGKGQYTFTGCHAGRSGGGIHAKVAGIAAHGSVSFRNCTATDKGSAVACTHTLRLSGSGHYDFMEIAVGGDQATADAALSAASVDISTSSLVSVINSREATMIKASAVKWALGGNISIGSVLCTECLAARGVNQSRDICPAGSAFRMLPTAPIPDRFKCTACPLGRASIVPASVNVTGEVNSSTVLSPGVKLVFVHKGSVNEALIRGLHGDGPYSMVLLQRKHWGIIKEDIEDGWSRGEYSQKSWYMTHGISAGRWPLTFAEGAAAALKLSYVDGKHFREETEEEAGLWLSAKKIALNSPLSMTTNSSLATAFDIDRSAGTISPRTDPGLVLGISHQETYDFDPQPTSTCQLCEDIVDGDRFDMLECLGGSQLQAKSGFMLTHESGSSTVHLHQCPNSKACPGGLYSVVADSSRGIQRDMCSKGYNSERQGCAACAADYGRAKFDPFSCGKCNKSSILQGIGMMLVSSSILYYISLRSARPRTKSQQVVRIILSFLTVQCKCFAALRASPFFISLQSETATWAKSIIGATLAVVYLTSMGTGGSDPLSYDCWFDRPVTITESLAVELAMPMALLAVSLLQSIYQDGVKEALTCVIVWANVFIAPLTGAAAKFFPCIALEKTGARFLMYNFDGKTHCRDSSSLLGIIQNPQFQAGSAVCILLALVGPGLGWWLIRNAAKVRLEDAAVVRFLVAGYRPDALWWESIVLIRKMMIYFVAASFPMSWAYRAYTVCLMLTLFAAELLHMGVQPYSDAALNSLESYVLCVSLGCMGLVTAIQLEIPLQPETEATLHIGCFVVVLMLETGTFAYLLAYYLHLERKAADDQEVPSDDGQLPDLDEQNQPQLTSEAAANSDR